MDTLPSEVWVWPTGTKIFNPALMAWGWTFPKSYNHNAIFLCWGKLDLAFGCQQVFLLNSLQEEAAVIV
jgi:hypothetical protein